MKMITVTFLILIPQEAFLFPDVLAEQYQQVIIKTNEVRAEHGLPALKPMRLLDASSQAKADDMADYHYFGHVGPSNRSLAYFLDNAKYQYSFAGENLAMGFSDAGAVVKAWQGSPTHNANLVDKDFKEIGVGLQTGYYHGAPTVYVAQHFGTPLLSTETEKSVLPPTIVLEDKSWVYWLDTPEGTELQVRAYIHGPVSSATAMVGGYIIVLKPSGGTLYTAKLVVPNKSDTFFKPVILPTVIVLDTSGLTHTLIMDWFAPKVVDMTPMEKYVQGQKVLGSETSLFAWTNLIFGAILLFFAGALTTYLVLQVRKHNLLVVGQTLVLLLLVGVLRFF